MKLYTSPARPMLDDDEPLSLFLAGSIEMGKATDWQQRVIGDLSAYPVRIFNPRRENWDSSWKQDISDPQFNEQVTWEMDYLEATDIVFLYFEPSTLSPITMGELYFLAGTSGSGSTVIVVCPEGFWRRGNVQIVCDRAAFVLCETLDEGVHVLKQAICDKSRGCAH